MIEHTMKYFEDFDVGDTYTTGGRTITKSDITRYVQLCGLYEEAFVNEEFIREESMFDEPFAPGELVLSFALGNVARSGYLEADIVLLEVDSQFENPVFAGDTIYVKTRVADTRETSDPERGILTFEDTITNQDDDVVSTMTKTAMIRRRTD